MSVATVQPQDIVNYYDDCHVDYQIVWHLNKYYCMHYGYWDETTPGLRSALVNMNAKVAEMAAIQGGERVLDAGCGVGGSSFYLAGKYDCDVEGITLSEKQAAYAGAKAGELGLSNKVRFSVDDFTRTGFPDAHFDVVWAIESVCHAAEKAAFLREAWRVLKPGGRLIVADFFRTERPPEPDINNWMGKWEDSWAVPAFETLENFMASAEDAGFSLLTTKDATNAIYPTARRLYYCFVPGLICDSVLKVLGKRKKTNFKNVWSTLYQYKALKSDLWRYHFFSASKE